MNSLVSTVRMALACFAAGVIVAPCPAAQPASEARPADRDLLTENPRLQQLIAEANRASGPQDVLQLADADVDSSVMQKFIETSNHRYDLNADQIIQLHQRGVAPEVITAMIRQNPGPVAPPAPAIPAAVSTVVQPQGTANTTASTVIYLANSPRPVRYAYQPRYLPPYLCSPRWPNYNWRCTYYSSGYWNRRPAWSYDFRFRGDW